MDLFPAWMETENAIREATAIRRRSVRKALASAPRIQPDALVFPLLQPPPAG